MVKERSSLFCFLRLKIFQIMRVRLVGVENVDRVNLSTLHRRHIIAIHCPQSDIVIFRNRESETFEFMGSENCIGVYGESAFFEFDIEHDIRAFFSGFVLVFFTEAVVVAIEGLKRDKREKETDKETSKAI